MFETIRVEKLDKTIEVVLDRPPVNAVSSLMYQELAAAFREISDMTDVHAVILRSSQRLFCAGADLREAPAEDTAEETGAELRQRLARTCYESILSCRIPVIAVVHGKAIGAGAVLAACSDIRYVTRDTQFSLPEIRAGRCGGGAHLMRLLPQGQVRLMYFTGEPIDAMEASRTGLAQYVGDTDETLEAARKMANDIAAKSPLGLRLAKEALNEAERGTVEEGYRSEQKYTLRLAAHPDSKEAAEALMQKREPVWSWPLVGE